MATLITDPDLETRLKAERELSGADRFDEVWEGTYMMSPIADFEHQQIQFKLGAALQAVIGWDSKATILTGVNVSDREKDWTQNYRCPDVALYFPDSTARIFPAHTVGGPDFAVEILSPYDRSREKFDFYANVNVRELLLVDRDPWSLELYRLDPATKTYVLAGSATLANPHDLPSRLLPISFALAPGTSRPTIIVAHRDTSARWNI